MVTDMVIIVPTDLVEQKGVAKENERRTGKDEKHITTAKDSRATV